MDTISTLIVVGIMVFVFTDPLKTVRRKRKAKDVRQAVLGKE